jgi:hypothetical protein
MKRPNLFWKTHCELVSRQFNPVSVGVFVRWKSSSGLVVEFSRRNSDIRFIFPDASARQYTRVRTEQIVELLDAAEEKAAQV